jgi:probable phosphoglycerate mutase
MVVAHGAAITLGITALLGLDTNGFRGLAGLENCHRSVLEPVHAEGSEGLMRLLSHNLPPDFT